MNKAHRLRVPIPQIYNQIEGKMVETKFWEREYDGGYHLTEDGVAKLREGIRSEIRWKQECREHWLKWIPALTGLVGTIIGLIAMIKK